MRLDKRVQLGVRQLAPHKVDGPLLRRARSAAAQRVAYVEAMNQVVFEVSHVFSYQPLALSS